MPTPTKEELEKLAREAAEREADEQEALALADEARLQHESQLALLGTTPTKVDENPVALSVKKRGGDWNDILADYLKKDYCDKESAEKGTLIFPTMADAETFMKEQAELERSFAVQRVVDDKPIDEFYFSCGDKKVYSGTHAEITKQLKDNAAGLALFNACVPAPPQSASDLRGKLAEAKAKAAAADAADPDSSASGAPSPTSTRI